MKWYKLVFRQEQPVYLGKSKYGVLSRTNLFISGYTMWGALTNMYIIKQKISKEQDIKAAGDKFKTVTCFFPALEENGYKEENKYKVLKVLYPKYDEGLLYFSSESKDSEDKDGKDNKLRNNELNYSEDEFRFRFVDSILSTAIEPHLGSAKDESLHMTEVICQRDKIRGSRLYWVGLLALEDSENPEEIAGMFSEIFIGGDSRYGLGLMRLESGLEEIGEEELKRWGLSIEGKIKESVVLRNYIEIKPGTHIKTKGEYGLIYEHSVYTGEKRAVFCIYPGSELPSGLNDAQLDKGKFISD